MPHVREVFQRNLDETRWHYDMITSEYMRVVEMDPTLDDDLFAYG